MFQDPTGQEHAVSVPSSEFANKYKQCPVHLGPHDRYWASQISMAFSAFLLAPTMQKICFSLALQVLNDGLQALEWHCRAAVPQQITSRIANVNRPGSEISVYEQHPRTRRWYCRVYTVRSLFFVKDSSTCHRSATHDLSTNRA